MAILLDEDPAGFVDRQVACGHDASVDEVIEAGLRLLAERDAVRDALIEDEASGRLEDFDAEEFQASTRRVASR